MNRFKRIRNILSSLCVILVSIMMFVLPDMGYVLATYILGTVLLLRGLQQFLYFFTMGIHMVGGRVILYRALITMDIGVFTLAIHGTGQRYIMFYFIMYYVFSGMVSIFRAMESRKYGAGSWKANLAMGIYDVSIALICLTHNNSEQVMLDILCLALILSSVSRIAAAFRKSAIIYIP